ncbi:MAG: hypothetical protein IPK28_06405 [Devosia sp.]|nr:hypothetical protein [Devosia sp.]
MQDEAKALIEHLSNPDFMNAYFDVAIYGPVLKNQEQLAAFGGQNTILTGLPRLAKAGTAPAYPDVYNAAYADLSSNFIIPKMAQRVVVDGWDFDRRWTKPRPRARPSTTSTDQVNLPRSADSSGCPRHVDLDG